MKSLNGSDLASFIRQRQASEARRLAHKLGRPAKLAIIQCASDAVTSKYTELKVAYGEDIGVYVDLHQVEQSQVTSLISQLNTKRGVDAIIVQLPLPDAAQTDEIVTLINPAKDVDGLGQKSKFDPATPTAILWLLSGYNIELKDKKVLIIGQGRLVGAPLSIMLNKSSIPHEVVDDTEKNLQSKVIQADIIITATGQPGLLTSDMIKPHAVVVDAGTSSESGKIKGDLAPEVYQRDDLTLTPIRGGVGPLTVSALFENVLKAAHADTIKGSSPRSSAD